MLHPPTPFLRGMSDYLSSKIPIKILITKYLFPFIAPYRASCFRTGTGRDKGCLPRFGVLYLCSTQGR